MTKVLEAENSPKAGRVMENGMQGVDATSALGFAVAVPIKAAQGWPSDVVGLELEFERLRRVDRRADEDLEIRAALQDVDRFERLRRLGDGAGVGKHDAAHLEGVSWRSQRAKARRTYPLAVARVLLAFAL